LRPADGVLTNLRHLLRYRGLIRSLAARELKARYRGSLLGFFWSFVNPLLLLLIYSFVFTVVMPGKYPPEYQPYALFMFCGILPWTWFSSSLLESSGSLVAGGNLIRKVLFPAEVLPITAVLASLAHFCLGLLILGGFLIYYRAPIAAGELLWLPVIMLVQLVLTLGIALLVSALTALFRDVRDLLANLLTLWFFATPIIYPLSIAPDNVRPFLNLNPFTHLAVAYQEVLFRPGPFVEWRRLALVGVLSVIVFLGGYFVFDRLRDALPEEV
jgi:lipopolysaccharide transport system permease protein